jgi:hypothetical protein
MRILFISAVVLVASAAIARAQVPGPLGELQNMPVPSLSDAKVGGKTYADWARDLNAFDPAVKEAAMQAMVVFASEQTYLKTVHKEAVPEIVNALNNPATMDVSLKVNGTLALGMINGAIVSSKVQPDEKILKSAVDCLARLTRDNESIVRFYATAALANIGQEARAAIPYLVAQIKDRAAWETRRAAVAGLAKMAWGKSEKEKEQGPDLKVFRALTDAVHDHCLQVRQEALKGFIFGTGALMINPPDPKQAAAAKSAHNQAVTALEELLSQRDKSTSVLARVALMVIDPRVINNPATMDSHVHAINRLLRPPSGIEQQVRIDASYGLSIAWQLASSKRAATPPDPKSFMSKTGWGETIHFCILNLEERDETIVCWACSVLGTMGEAAKKAIPSLERLRDKVASRPRNDVTKSMVERALAQCRGKEAGPIGAANRAGP